MFSGIFNTVLQKLSGLNPIKPFIKYALDKFLNQLINDKITLQDFKDGCLNLKGIGFNVDKVNQKHLISSPYMMHSGSIGGLKIKLPQLTELSSKSIEVQVREILVQLKPNKNFYVNFKERIKQLQQNRAFDYQQSIQDQQISQNNPLDFFKQTLKQILLNIKVKVENIVVKIYMNDLSEKTNKAKYYLMLRIPTINIHKSNNFKGNSSKHLQEIKLDIEMPQFTIHLINQGTQFSEFSNQNCKKDDFPSKYPTINHCSTILLFGLHDFRNLNIQTDKSVPRLTFSIVTDYKNKKRDMKILALTSKVQLMLDPLQIKVLSRYVHQLKQFKNIFSFVKNQLNFGNQSYIDQSASHDITSLKRNRSSDSRNEDIFSSICMSIWQPQATSKSRVGSKSRKSPNVIDSMIRQSSDLTKSIDNFNFQFKKQLQQRHKFKQVSQQISAQLRVVNFEKNMQITLQVNQVYIYVLKNTPKMAYCRKWMACQKENKINQSIPESYFMFSIQSLNFNLKQNGKVVKLQLARLKLQNVKLYLHSSSANSTMSPEDQFVDIQQGELFQSCQEQFSSFQTAKNASSSLDPNIIKQFQLYEKDHYCVQDVLRISQRPSQNFYSEKVRKYNFLPKSQQTEELQGVLYKPGFKFCFDSTQKTPQLRIVIQEIAVSLNPEIVKQTIEIYFPVASFSKLSDSFSGEQLSHAKSQTKFQAQDNIKLKKRSLLESQYNFGLQYYVVEQYIQKKQKLVVKISIQQINLGFYESPMQNFSSLIHKYKQNKCDSHGNCFCTLSKRGLYFECFGIEIDKVQENLKINLKRILSGFMQLKNSKLQRIKAFFSIQSKKQQKNLTLILQKNQSTKVQNIFLIIPEISVIIEEKYILSSIQLIKQEINVAEQVFQYYNFLRSQMESISRETFNVEKKQMKKYVAGYQKNVQLYVQTFHLILLKNELYVRHMYLKKFAEQITLKLSTLVFSMRQDVQLFLNQMKNQQLCLRQHVQKVSRYPFTKDSNIIFQIHDDTYKPGRFQIRNRVSFFDNLSKTKGCFLFYLSKNPSEQSGANKVQAKQTLSKGEKFQFTKKPNVQGSSSKAFSNSSAIAEQQQLKQIFINISSPIYISANNCTRMIQHKQHLIQLVSKVIQLKNQIMLQSKALSSRQRKNSTDSDIERLQQIEIRISAGKVNVDVRPSFVQRNLKGDQSMVEQKSSIEREVVFSSTRSFLQFEWQNVDVDIHKRTLQNSVKGNFGVKYHFLQHEQRQIVTNPIFIHEKQLKLLGFVEIFSLGNLKLELGTAKQHTNLKIQIISINYESSISTLAYLKLHWEHFLNHNVKRNFGLTIKEQEQNFQLIEFEQSQIKEYQRNCTGDQDPEDYDDFQIEDLTDAREVYTEKKQRKAALQCSFKLKPFQAPKPDKDCQFSLQLFKVKQLKVRIYSGSDFEFISCSQMNQSKEKKRSRVNDSQILKYLQIRLDLFSTSMKVRDLGKVSIQTFARIQNMQVNFSNRKKAKSFFERLITSNNYTQQIVFPILRSQGEVKLLLQHDSQKTYLKLNKTVFDCGFTSEILELVDEIKLVNRLIKDSGWRKVYDKSHRNAKQPVNVNQASKSRLVLIYMPQNRLNVRLVFKGIILLSNQSLSAGQFLLHQESNNIVKIKKSIIKWVKRLLFNNIAGLISGSALNFMGGLIQEVLQLVRFLLGMAFRGSQANQLE